MSSFWQQTREFWDRLLRGGKQSGGVIAERLCRRATMQKVAARIRGLNRERSQLISTIGKKVYSLHTRGKVQNRDVLSDCLRIDEAGQEIEALQQQMEELRREAAAGEELVVDIEDEAPLAEEAEEEASAVEPPEQEPAQPRGEDLVMDVEDEAAEPQQLQQEECADQPPGEQASLAD